jgi:quercetin dioxygenase-like cupin family protein
MEYHTMIRALIEALGMHPDGALIGTIGAVIAVIGKVNGFDWKKSMVVIIGGFCMSGYALPALHEKLASSGRNRVFPGVYAGLSESSSLPLFRRISAQGPRIRLGIRKKQTTEKMNVNTIVTITGLLNLSIFVGLVYMTKQILDSEKVIAKHPYLRNPLLRVFLIMMVVGPLVVSIKPDWRDIGHLIFDLGILGVLLMVGYLYDRYFLKVSLTYTSSVQAQYVGAEQYISIPSEKYIQVAPGVWDRRIMHPDDWLSEEEAQKFGPSLELFDFAHNVMLLVRFSEEADFPEHYHAQEEAFYIAEGEVYMGEQLGSFKAGDTVRIPAQMPHVFSAKEEGCCIIALKKI